jgi:hypothetical protein
MEKRQTLLQMLLGKLDSHMQKTETRSLSFCANINSKWIQEGRILKAVLKQGHNF